MANRQGHCENMFTCTTQEKLLHNVCFFSQNPGEPMQATRSGLCRQNTSDTEGKRRERAGLNENTADLLFNSSKNSFN